MPVALEPEDFECWLGAAMPIEELRELLKPYPAERMRAEAVSRRINSVKNDDEDSIASIGEPPLAVT
jgi:putative SOS response-associated peptidase YedK